MRPYLRLLPFMLLTVAVACASGGGAVDGVAVDTGSVFSLRIEQSDGETLVLDRPSARIISLAAHATEVFCALGAGDRLIAVDKHANCPLGSRAKPEVDSFQPNLEAIAGFEPDLVFVFSDQGGIVEALRSLGTPVLYLKSPATLDGVFEQIEVLGRVTDKDAAANALSDRLKAQRDAITARVAAVAQGPRVFHELSPDFYNGAPGYLHWSAVCAAQGRERGGGGGHGVSPALRRGDHRARPRGDRPDGRCLAHERRRAARLGQHQRRKDGPHLQRRPGPCEPAGAADYRRAGGAGRLPLPGPKVAMTEAVPATRFEQGEAAWRWRQAALPLSALALLVSLLLGVALGPVAIGPDNVVGVLLAHVTGLATPVSEATDAIVWQIRLPRVLLAALVGATLALSGAAYQGVFRNPLADPYLLGVASGAGLAATAALVSGLPLALWGVSLLTLIGFAGALIAMLLAYSLARVAGRVPTTTLILAGVAISSINVAGISYLMLVSPGEHARHTRLAAGRVQQQRLARHRIRPALLASRRGHHPRPRPRAERAAAGRG